MTSLETVFSPSPADFDLRTRTGDALRFAHLTYPVLSQHLCELSECRTQAWLAIGAERGGEPAGLALGSLDGETALLRSIQVTGESPNSNLGQNLLAAWEREAAARGALRLRMRFSQSNPRRDELTSLLCGHGWDKPSVFLFQFVGEAGAMERQVSAWKGLRGRILPDPSITCGPLDLRPEDDAEVERMLGQPEARGFSDPRKLAPETIAEITLSVRRHRQLVGWIIAKTGSPTLAASLKMPGRATVYYSDFYLDRPLWRTGLGIAVFVRAFRAQIALFGENSLAVYNTREDLPGMAALSRRRFAPLAIRFDTIFTSEKIISDV